MRRRTGFVGRSCKIPSGKLADLVLLDADPLDDITNITTIPVMSNGRYFDRIALDNVLSDVRQDEMTARMMTE